jgi:sugar (pentulose or hexulose) kinase
MGSVDDHAHLDDAFYEAGFKNAGGANGWMILYRDFAACWIVNRLMSEWQREGKAFSFEEMDRKAAAVRKRMGHFDTDAPGINDADGSMERRIIELVVATGLPVPESHAEIARCVFESIALKVAHSAAELSRAVGRRFARAWLISGGSRFACLTGLIADALDMPASVGLPSATLVGNAVAQFVCLEELSYDVYAASAGSGAPLFKAVSPLGSGRLRDESARSA